MQRKSKGIATYCMAQKSTARAELRMAKICVAKRGHGKDLLGVTRHSKGIAWQGDGQQRKGRDKLCIARARQGRARHSRAKASQGIAWQCSARAEDTYKGAGERAEQ